MVYFIFNRHNKLTLYWRWSDCWRTKYFVLLLADGLFDSRNTDNVYGATSSSVVSTMFVRRRNQFCYARSACRLSDNSIPAKTYSMQCTAGCDHVKHKLIFTNVLVNFRIFHFYFSWSCVYFCAYLYLRTCDFGVMNKTFKTSAVF